jgi:DNA (cytosine-5)-methyltransferase 1
MTAKPACLDLFSGAGGCARGYQDAGFFVVGVDIASQPRYIGGGFIQADALDILRRLIAGEGVEDEGGRVWRLEDFMLIHASPPCQAYSRAQRVHKKAHPKMIRAVRGLLESAGLPYVIENVKGSPLKASLMLCGTMFDDLMVIRHRYFESNIDLGFPPYACSCKGKSSRGILLNYHNTKARNLYLKNNGYSSGADAFRDALQVGWMTFDESQEAIPPKYTAYIGRQILAALEES